MSFLRASLSFTNLVLTSLGGLATNLFRWSDGVCSNRGSCGSTHLAYTLIHVGILGQRINLHRGELQHSAFAGLGCHLRLDNANLLLREGGLLFDLGEKLRGGSERTAQEQWRRRLTFCKASLEMDMVAEALLTVQLKGGSCEEC